ncbi:MAG TPA: serine hydrolase domain-containing protein [Parvularculaceae bacterium]|nr:serine hydrolase domain-containing protein [Parvularculaceae bacterium]
MDVDRRIFIGGAAVAAGLVAASGAQAKSRGNGGKAEAKALKALEAYVGAHRADWGIPGMTVVIVTRDGFEGYVASGLADVERKIPVGPDHLFQIGSISKMFTALGAYSLADEGKLSPDVRLSDALKGVSVKGGDAITLQHLLNHTSGLPADSSIFPEGGLWVGFKPGTDWSYSNAGYDLAGKIAAAAHGGLYTELIKTRILDKLGMVDSRAEMRVADRYLYAQGYEQALTDRLNPRPSRMTPTPWVDSDSPAGCVAATAGDMAKFMRFLLDLASGKGAPLFSDETAKKFLADPADGWGPGAKYGNGIARIEVDGRKYLHHTGGMVSFCSSLHVDPESGVAAFASANIHYSLNYRPVRVTTYACELMRAIREGIPSPAPKPTMIALEKPEQYAGAFVSEAGDRFETIVKGGEVQLQRDGRVSALQQASGALFASADEEFAVTGVVIEAEEGRAVRAWIGEKEYLVDATAGFTPPAPDALRALAGRYDNDDRWAGPLYVYARDGGLYIGNIEKLTPLSGGEWRPSGENSPERVRFDGYINGRPHRMLVSGTPYIRRFS